MLDFWHFDRNMEVSPEQVGICSHRKVWWRHICPTTGEEHEWQATVSNIYKAYMQDERLGRGEHRHTLPNLLETRQEGALNRGQQADPQELVSNLVVQDCCIQTS